MNASDSSAEHQDIWELIPWLVNGRLGEPDAQRATAHLRVCAACREEHASQQAVYQIISATTAVEQMPMAGLNKLRQRLDGDEGSAKSASMSRASDGRRTDRRTDSGIRRRIPVAMAAAAAVLVTLSVAIAAAVHWSQSPRQDDAPAYYTVTSAQPAHAGAVIRAVFASSITLSELQSVLDDAHLRIVSGPTEAGVYSLAMNDSSSIDGSLQKLRAREAVRFAEAIGPATATSAPP